MDNACKIDNIKYQIIQCIQYHKVTKYIPSNAIKTVQYHTTLYDIPYEAFLTKTEHFWPKKGHFGQSGLENGLPSSLRRTYWKTEGIQSYLGIWGRYDPIKLGLSEAKKVGYMGIA